MSSFFSKAKNAAQDLLKKIPHDAPKVTHAKKILFAITGAAPAMPDHRTGFFWSELVQPYEEFIKNGWDCDIVSESGHATPDEASLDKMALAGDKKRWEDKEYTLHKKLGAIRPASAVKADDYAAIYFPGGHACCVDFPNAVALKKLAADIYEKGGVVGAVCHGPAIFQNLSLSNGKSLLEGKEATGFSKKGEDQMKASDWLKQNNYLTMEQIVVNAGGVWKEASDPMAEYTITSDRVVTGMNPLSAGPVAKGMLTFLPKEDAAPASAEKDVNVGGHKIPGSAIASIKGALAGIGGDKNAAASSTDAEKAKTYEGEKTSAI